MVNLGFGWSSFVGMSLAAAGLALFFLRSLRPKLARDYDIFFAAVALLCGGILLFQGWRQDPILQFGQFLLTGTAVFFGFENIRLRGATTEQAKRNSPIVDGDRPVSRVYRAEIDDFDTFDAQTATPRIPGTRDSRTRNDYGDRPRRSSSSRASLDDRSNQADRPRRPRRSDEDSFDQDYSANDDLQGRSRSRGTDPTRPGQPGAARPRRPRPDDDVVRSRGRRSPEAAPSEYVDYRPIDNDNETDNWGDS